MPVDLSIELRLSYLRAAQAAQEEEEAKIQDYRDFFDGEQGLELSDRQEDYLTLSPESLGNICKRTVNIPKERLEIKDDGIAPADDGSQGYADLVTEWWNANKLHSEQKEVYKAALRDGSVAVIVGWDEAKGIPTFTPNLLYDGVTGLVRLHYDSDNNLIFASKRWTVWNPIIPGETGNRRMTVYRPDVIERYEADRATPGGWRFLNPDEIIAGQVIPNPQPWTTTGDFSGDPLGIPVIPFENPDGSELEDVLVIQELLNHNLATMDITIDYHGFPLMWFSDANFPVDSSTGKSIMPDFGPRQAINLGKDGEAGRIEAADIMALFQGGVISWVQVLALLKGWPIFMFDRSQQPPSGVALQTMEGSLVKQVIDKQAVFGGAWLKAFDMGRKLYQLRTSTELAGEVTLSWESPKTNDELAHIEALSRKFEAGQVPVLQRWRELGYTQDEIDRMLADQAMQDDFGLIGTEVTGVSQ